MQSVCMSDTSARLAAYREAELLILQGEEVRRDGRSLRLPQLAEVRDEIRRLERKLAAERNAAGLRVVDLRGPQC